MGEATKRDPFAPPGYPGNRGIQYGEDGVIPAHYRVTMEKAIRLAYQLAFNHAFEAAFNNTVSKLTNQTLGKNAYLDALDKMIIHHAETSKNPKAVKELKDDSVARGADKSYQSPPAFSLVGGRAVWLREFLLKWNDPREVAGALMHEAAHLAGAPGDLLAEMALEKLGEVSGYPRR
jgi:hypothetical protein